MPGGRGVRGREAHDRADCAPCRSGRLPGPPTNPSRGPALRRSSGHDGPVGPTLMQLLSGVLATVLVLVAALLGALLLVATPLGVPKPKSTDRRQAGSRDEGIIRSIHRLMRRHRRTER